MKYLIEVYAFIVGISYLLKVGLHIYINFQIIPNYWFYNRNNVGIDFMVLLAPIKDNVPDKLIRLKKTTNYLYYFALASAFVFIFLRVFDRSLLPK